MYIPSYDFRIFDIPFFSPLQAQEYGASTTFNANTPLSYVDFSLNQLAGLSRPNASYPYEQNQFPSVIDTFGGETFFQGAGDTRDRLRKVRDEADRLLKESGDTSGDCPQGRNIFGGCGPILGSKKVISDGKGTLGNDPTKSGEKFGAFAEVFKTLPEGSGVFLIALVVIILLFLFVKR